MIVNSSSNHGDAKALRKLIEILRVSVSRWLMAWDLCRWSNKSIASNPYLSGVGQEKI